MVECGICGGGATDLLDAKQVGYVEGTTYSIYGCQYCETQFVHLRYLMLVSIIRFTRMQQFCPDMKDIIGMRRPYEPPAIPYFGFRKTKSIRICSVVCFEQN